MKLNLLQIDRVENISKRDFVKNYVKPQKPLVIEKMVDEWPAIQKWDFDYLKSMEKYFDSSVGTTIEKLANFTKYVPKPD